MTFKPKQYFSSLSPPSLLSFYRLCIKKISRHIFICLYFHLPAGNLWQSDHWVLEKWLEWLYSARFVCSRHAWDYEHCGVDFNCQGDNRQREEPLEITRPQPQLRLVEVFSMIMICDILKVIMVHDRTENLKIKRDLPVSWSLIGILSVTKHWEITWDSIAPAPTQFLKHLQCVWRNSQSK